MNQNKGNARHDKEVLDTERTLLSRPVWVSDDVDLIEDDHHYIWTDIMLHATLDACVFHGLHAPETKGMRSCGGSEVSDIPDFVQAVSLRRDVSSLLPHSAFLLVLSFLMQFLFVSLILPLFFHMRLKVAAVALKQSGHHSLAPANQGLDISVVKPAICRQSQSLVFHHPSWIPILFVEPITKISWLLFIVQSSNMFDGVVCM